MFYIYDQLEQGDMSVRTYMKEEYELAAKNYMGDLVYFTYKNAAGETLIVVPSFAQQFYEAAKLYQTIKTARSRKAIEMRIVNRYRVRPETTIDDAAETNCSFRVNYRNISFLMFLNQEKFTIAKEFTIISGNIFGKNVRVSVEENPEILKYCEY